MVKINTKIKSLVLFVKDFFASNSPENKVGSPKNKITIKIVNEYHNHCVIT